MPTLVGASKWHPRCRPYAIGAGSLRAGQHLVVSIVGIAGIHSGNGYWMVAKDRGVFNYGDGPFLGVDLYSPHPGQPAQRAHRRHPAPGVGDGLSARSGRTWLCQRRYEFEPRP